jgi:hypothetical protein
VEGGFNGRTNKLVDGCYSFWQGGVFPILQELLCKEPQQQEGDPEQPQQQVGLVAWWPGCVVRRVRVQGDAKLVFVLARVVNELLELV